jgi:thioredoxin reductase (NADPH)
MSQDLFLDLGEVDRERISAQQYDVIIIGGGPAGLAAGLYTARAKLDALLIEKDPLHCNLCLVKRIDNYPGFPEGISGRELTYLMEMQARRFGLQIEVGSVIDITNDSDVKTVKTNIRNFRAKALIITTGISRKRQGVDGEEDFRGKGVSYCATCDGPFFKDVPVAVAGGGEEALEEAIFLTKFASRVTVIHSQEELSGNEQLQRMAADNEKISLLLNSEVTKISGKERVEFVEVLDLNTGNAEQLSVGGVFLYTGTRPVKDFLSQLMEMDERGYIITDQDMKTSVEGIFAAGDVRYKKVRQVATAVGDGVTAASSARKYVQNL